MSELKINTQNGSTTTFNFKFDNGLPVKPIINPAYQAKYSKEQDQYQLHIFLSKEEAEKIEDIEIEGYACEIINKRGNIWLIINDLYLVLGDLNVKIIEELQNKKLDFCFFNEENAFIKGVRLE
jgi:hypothetical protein